jgi:carbon storage regulator CsrA
MLVLSRRQDQSFCFPNLGIKVQVLRTGGKVVRLGIDAPKDVAVLREELLGDCDHEAVSCLESTTGMSKEQRHDFRDRLNAASLGLQVLQQRIESGQTVDLDSLIEKIFSNLSELNDRIDEQKKVGHATAQARRPRALIVEDNPNEGQLLAEFLRTNGYRTDVVANGDEAMSYLLQHERPDVVLLDMSMPIMNGPQTVKSIRREPELRELRLFGVSGQDNEEAGVEIGNAGVNGWFTKPVDARRIVREINSLLSDAVTTA